MLSRLSLCLITLSLMTWNIVEANDVGWNCKKQRLSGEWQCVSPKQPVVIPEVDRLAVEKKGWWWFADTFDAPQEQVFKVLQQSFDKNPWAMCVAPSAKQPTFIVDKNLRKRTPADVFADTSEMFDSDVFRFFGDIHFMRADQHIMADQMDYNKVSEELGLYGDVIYKDGGIAFYGQSVRVGMDDDTAILRDALFITPSSPGRGEAGVIYRENAFLNRMKSVSYTRCEPGNQDWMLHASKMKMNDETGRASVKHGWVEFKKVPLMYFPYGSFPIDDRRLSGLLTPTIGVSQRNGVDVMLPFYWNIAPNFDAVLTPRYMGSRGFMMGTDFRYLWDDTHGEINVEMMPGYKLSAEELEQQSDLEEWEKRQDNQLRWGGSFQHVTKFTDRLKMNIDANYVSDKAYFSDLDGTLGVNNRSRYLLSQGNISYKRSWMSLTTHVDNYQNIDPSASDTSVPYRRLPQIKLKMNKEFDKTIPVDLTLDSEYVVFQRHFPDGKAEGQRLNLKPAISFPFSSEFGFIEPKVAVQHTQYWLGNHTPNQSDTLSKTLPLVSVDGGLFFERDFESLTHTIEPRLFYLYVPYNDQRDLPNFDTSLNDFNTNQLFRDNEFNGADKTQNTNQITTALTSRLVENGHNRLKLTVGEIFYFEDRKVNLSGSAVNDELLSNLITELSSEITDDLKFSSSMQWSHKENAIDRGSVDLRYHGQDNLYIFNVGYRYRLERSGQAAQNQITASAMIPIYDGWSVIGLYRHSMVEGINLDHFYGIEKDTCCWRFRVLARRFIRSVTPDANGDIKPENSIFFQFELKGFSSLGDKLEDFLLKNISGYRKPTY